MLAVSYYHFRYNQNYHSIWETARFFISRKNLSNIIPQEFASIPSHSEFYTQSFAIFNQAQKSIVDNTSEERDSF